MNKEQQKDEVILIVKKAIDANTEQHFVDDDTVYIDGNDVDHIAEQVADEVYATGYRKTSTSDLASDTQKAFKEGYEKARNETAKEILNRINEYNLDYNWDLKVEFIKLCKDYDVEVEDD